MSEQDNDQAPAAKQDQAPAAKQDPARPPSLTVAEFLTNDLNDMRRQTLERQATVGGKGDAGPLVAGDAAVNEQRDKAPPARPGMKDLVKEIRAAVRAEPGNDQANSVLLNAKNGMYDPRNTDYGLGCLVPHLQSAGLFGLAKRVQHQEFDFDPRPSKRAKAAKASKASETTQK